MLWDPGRDPLVKGVSELYVRSHLRGHLSRGAFPTPCESLKGLFRSGGVKTPVVFLPQFTMQLVSMLFNFEVASRFYPDVVVSCRESGEAQSLPCEVLPQCGRLVRKDVDGGAQRLAVLLLTSSQAPQCFKGKPTPTQQP